MRLSLICLGALLLLGVNAQAYAPTEPCRFSFGNESVRLDIGPGFIIDYEPGEYTQGMGFYQAAPRRQWFKTGENKYEPKIVEEPVRMVRKRFMTAPDMFYLRDKNENIISHFTSRGDLKAYVCDVLYLNYGSPNKSGEKAGHP